MALFIPGFSGTRHAVPAIRVARRLPVETGHDVPDGPWLYIGVGIHSGTAFVGAVAVAGEVITFTALGDTVNAAARLASAARGGEVLISDSALANANVVLAGAERRQLYLKRARFTARSACRYSPRPGAVDGHRDDQPGR